MKTVSTYLFKNTKCDGLLWLFLFTNLKSILLMCAKLLIWKLRGFSENVDHNTFPIPWMVQMLMNNKLLMSYWRLVLLFTNIALFCKYVFVCH